MTWFYLILFLRVFFSRNWLMFQNMAGSVLSLGKNEISDSDVIPTYMNLWSIFLYTYKREKKKKSKIPAGFLEELWLKKWNHKGIKYFMIWYTNLVNRKRKNGRNMLFDKYPKGPKKIEGNF